MTTHRRASNGRPVASSSRRFGDFFTSVASSSRSHKLQLNRGEYRHDLAARCLFFANRGEFRTGDVDEIMNKASCLSLLSNAVLVWNSKRIEEIVGRLRVDANDVRDSDLARVSPLMFAHVIPNGTYRFDSASDQTEPDARLALH
jgi:hypothetical protein